MQLIRLCDNVPLNISDKRMLQCIEMTRYYFSHLGENNCTLNA